MSPNHECTQEDRIRNADEKAERVEREMYVGREGRSPMILRMDFVERVVKWQLAVAMAVLISVVIGSITLVIRGIETTRALERAQYGSNR